MFPNRLKLGYKRKESTGLRPTKLILAGHDKTNIENHESQCETEPVETTEVIKSTPNIQIYSPRIIIPESKTMAPFNHITNRPMSHRETYRHESKNDQLTSTIQELTEYKAKLEQNKIKIDECKSTISALTNENGSLKNHQKILEAEINNCSKDYYERQIGRLRAESQKYQIENMENIHRIQNITQEKAQLEASAKMKVDQIKNYIKQIQKERLTAIELRNQLNEKEKTFKFALQQSEKSNELLNINHFEMAEKYGRLEKDLAQKCKIIETLHQQNEIIVGRYKQCDEATMATRKRYEDVLAEKQAKIEAIVKQHKAIAKQQEQNVQKLQKQIKFLKEDQVSNSMKFTKMSADLKSEQQSVDKSAKIVRFEQELREMALQIAGKDQTIQSLQLTLKSYFSPEQYGNLDKKWKESEDKRMTSAKYYEEKLYALQKENERLKFEKLSTRSMPTSENVAEKTGSETFNQILKKTIQDNTVMKEELKAKIDQNQEIMSRMMEVKLKEKKYINDIEILTKKLQSQQKNVKVELEVEKQKFTNDIDSLRRKISTLETRLEYKISENKQKDDFIKNTIIGRGKLSDVPFIIAELERIFLERDKAHLT